MDQGRKLGLGRTLLVTLLAFLLVAALFYGLNHLIMNIQGLPLNLDLSPAG